MSAEEPNRSNGTRELQQKEQTSKETREFQNKEQIARSEIENFSRSSKPLEIR